MINNYPKAYKEILEIFKYIPEESVEKIPKNIIEVFENNKDDSYEFYIDETKNFNDQIILDETRAILLNLVRDYWALPEQRDYIIKKQNIDIAIVEENKKKQYSSNIFLNDNEKSERINREVKSNLPIEVKNHNLFNKIINWFKITFFKT